MKRSVFVGTVAACAFLAAVAWVEFDRWVHDTPQSGMELDPADCVASCIKQIHSNQVFPDFPAIVKSCDEKFGEGCRLRNK